jgi:hypothetical protein
MKHSTEALIRRERSIEASGCTRSDERAAALRAAGADAYPFDGARADRGIEAALWRGDAVVRGNADRSPYAKEGVSLGPSSRSE